jgi:hypothetical protein
MLDGFDVLLLLCDCNLAGSTVFFRTTNKAHALPVCYTMFLLLVFMKKGVLKCRIQYHRYYACVLKKVIRTFVSVVALRLRKLFVLEPGCWVQVSCVWVLLACVEDGIHGIRRVCQYTQLWNTERIHSVSG